MMAKAIKHIEKKETSELEKQTESLQELLTLLAKNSDAVKTTLEIVQELHHAGILDMLKGLLKTRDKVGVLAMDQLNQPNMHNTIKNGITSLQFLGEMNPEKIKTVLHAVNNGLDNINNQDEQKHKIGIFKAMRDPHIKESLSTAISFLQGMGEGIEKKKNIH